MTTVSRRLDIRLLDYRDLTHPEAGGAERYLHEIFSRLVGRGHRVRLLAARYPGAAPAERLGGIEVERRGARVNFNWVALAACRSWSRNGDGDLVVENLCKIPFFTHRLGGGIPTLTIVHHLFGDVVFQETNPAAAAYVRAHEWLIPPLYRGARVVAVSGTTREDLAARGLRPRSLAVIPNGVDLERFRPLPGGPPPGPARLLYLGRLKRYKRIDLLLHAAVRLRTRWPALQVEIIGRGDHRPDLERLARDLGLEGAVRFRGYLEETEKVERLRSATALVYPSPKEGWGIAAMEASACGVPVVASDAPGLREAVRHRRTGLLVPHGDVAALERAIEEILNDEGLRRRMGREGVSWAARFSWDAAATRMEECALEAAEAPG